MSTGTWPPRNRSISWAYMDRHIRRATTTTTHRLNQVCDLFFFRQGLLRMVAESSVRSSVGGVARHRRERRLRSWWPHEQQTVRMALAASTHHSAQQNAAPGARSREAEEQVTLAGLRALKTPPLGARLGILAEPGPQRSDRSLRRSAGDSLPTLAAGSAGEEMGITLSPSSPGLSWSRGRRRRRRSCRPFARKSGTLMAGTRPSAATVSSSSGTVARAVRSGCFLPLPRGGKGRRGGRSFPELLPLVASLIVGNGSGISNAGFAGVHFALCSSCGCQALMPCRQARR